MAINALVYSWSVHNALVPETPLEVRRTTARACGWLEKNILSDKIELYNSFFSGSIKTQEVGFLCTNLLHNILLLHVFF